MQDGAVRTRDRGFSKVGTDSLRAVQAGLLSLFLLFTTLATFGPWFQIAVAQGLTLASIVAGLAGLRWAHRASHSIPRNPGEIGQGYATVGLLASFLGIVVSATLNGAFLFILNPIVFLVLGIGALVFLAHHTGTRTQEAFFLGRLDPRDDTSTCAKCGGRGSASLGRWAGIGWTCGRCSKSRKVLVRHGALRGLLTLSVIATAMLVIPAGPATAFCEILEPPTDLPTEVRGTQIEIRLTEGFARVVIIKEFFNPSDRVKEGQVFFPLEKGHELITDLSLKIGNVVYNGTGQDREGALDEFLKDLANGKDAALVQYDPPRDVYWVAVTIPPKESRTTITTLEMPLQMRDGQYTYGYRLSVDAGHSTEYLRLHVRVETSAPLGAVRLPSHPALAIQRTGSNVGDAWINSTAESLQRDLTVQFASSGPSIGQFATTEIVNNVTVPRRYLRLSVDAGDPAFADSLNPLPRSFLLLLDASGSMRARNRWNLARNAALGLARDLRGGETFGVAVFQGNSVRLLAADLRVWGGDSEAKLANFLDPIEPGGSTNLAIVLPTATRWGVAAEARRQQPVAFVISDGRPTVNTVPIDIETAYRRASYQVAMPVIALAVEPAIHADENLLRNVSHFNHGDLVTVHPGETELGVHTALSLIRVPVLQGVRAEFPGAADVEFASRNPQDVQQGGESVVMARSTGTANDSVTVELTWTAPDGTQRLFSRTLAGAEIPVQPLLKKAWVLTRVHALLDEIAATNSSATIEELKALATANRVVTPYTSILVSIPTTPPPGTPPEDTANLGDFNPFTGLIGGPGAAGPGAPGSGGVTSGGGRPRDTPLDDQAREAERFWNDMNNPLLVEGELDRFVPEGSSEHLEILSLGSPIRFQGQSLTIYEVGGELVGVYGPRIDRANHLSLVFWNGVWGMFAFAMMAGLVRTATIRRRGSTRTR